MEENKHSRNIRRKSCKTQIDIPVIKNLREIVRHSERLHSQSQITGDSDAILPDPIALAGPISIPSF